MSVLVCGLGLRLSGGRGRSGVIYGLRGSLGGRPVGSHPGSNKLERGFHSGVCQHQRARGGMGFPQWPSPASRVMVSTSCLLPPASSGTSPRSADGSDPGLFQMAASALGPGVCGVLCVLFISHSPGSPKSKSCWPPQPDARGLVFPVQGLWAGESVRGSGLLLLGKQLCICKLFLPRFWGLSTQGCGP